MPSFAQFGVEPSFLSLIVGQAAIVLIACSILLAVVKDLFEVKTIRVGLAGAEIQRTVPVLANVRADFLRVAIRAFSFALPSIYLALALCVAMVERSPIREIDGKPTKIADIKLVTPIWSTQFQLNLQTIYYWELMLHLAIVVIVSVIFWSMVRIRHDDCRDRMAGGTTV